MNGLARRISKIEQKLGSDTVFIDSITDLVIYANNIERGIDVCKVTFSPEIEQLLRGTASTDKEGESNEQKY